MGFVHLDEFQMKKYFFCKERLKCSEIYHTECISLKKYTKSFTHDETS